MAPVVNGTFEVLTKKAQAAPTGAQSNLIIITLDAEKAHEQPSVNEPESEVVYKKQEHLSSAVSMLIDVLPTVINANNDEAINKWIVAGISLGAHAAWMVVDRDPRIDVCIPILGSPDFLDIVTVRSNLTCIPLLSSFMTLATRNYIIQHDPVSRHRSPERPNPFVNKHILAIIGAQDCIVPLLPTRQFIDRINVGPLGSKRLIIQEGVGHQCTREMIVYMAEFVWTVALA